MEECGKMRFVPVCPEGVCNCIFDPAYIAARNQALYWEIYGERTPEQVTEWLMNQLERNDNFCIE